MQLYLSENIPKYMSDFTQFCCDEIGLSSLRGEVFLNLKQGSIESDSYGITWGDDREVTVLIATHQFGKPLSREDKLKTVAHELVHAHQFLTRKMREMDEVDRWELDAIESEEILYEEWLSRV